MKRLADLMAPLALIAILLAGWEIACRALQVPAYFLPAPSPVALSPAAAPGPLPALAWDPLAIANAPARERGLTTSAACR